MSLAGKDIGVAITGSFCTLEDVFIQIEELVQEGANVQTIFSEATQTIDSRFGLADNFYKKAFEITQNKPVCTIETAEPIGPQSLLDALLICPCTGNTLAKLAAGITDTPVLMAAKAHMRNDKPLIISLSTNDALGLNMKNIGLLMSTKLIYFVPFGQDNPKAKPKSMVSDTNLVIPTIKAALTGRQYQPVILGPTV